MHCTGYTHTIENGTCKTPKDFLKLCLKNFGCCMELRDESLYKFNIDDYLEKLKNKTTSEYLVTSLKNAEKELDKCLKKTDSEWQKELDSKITDTERKLEEHKKKHEEEMKLLSYFKNGIDNWNCSSQYQNIKNFALEQLEITEADDYEWDEKLLNEYRETTVQDYKLSNIKSAIREVELYKENIEAEKKRRNEMIKFIEGFLKEIENM